MRACVPIRADMLSLRSKTKQKKLNKNKLNLEHRVKIVLHTGKYLTVVLNSCVQNNETHFS